MQMRDRNIRQSERGSVPASTNRKAPTGWACIYPLQQLSLVIVIAAAAVWLTRLFPGTGCRAARRERLLLLRVQREDVGPRQVRREGAGQGEVSLLPGGPAVPGGASAPAVAEGQLRRTGGRRSPRLPGRSAGVPLGGDLGAGRQRCPRQQEDPHHPPAPSAGHPQRRGAQQAAGRRHHRPGRRPPQHSGRPTP